MLTYLLPLLICLWRWHSLQPAYRQLILAGLLTLGSLNVLAEVGRVVYHNNLLCNYLIIWAETLFLGWAYHQALHSRRSRQLLLAALVFFAGVALAEFLYWHGISGAKTYTRMARGIVLVGAALLYFEQTLQELRNIHLERDPMFLVSVGVTLYYSGTLMVFAMEYATVRRHQFDQVWMMYSIQAVLMTVLNTLIALALWHTSRAEAKAETPILY
ncbi:hypothetical protein [Hymenobacter persicinus]|uniref:Uncharacterized protein n=1 Tax=Hymenobacter persicinus TaxID=2025506 RepID=A0A4Q5LG40_9BACT|nr:hypothetical protein [Hymenobacter persicinus]RYU82180.1 hypothetical protein EWM57_05205 [Hymenobacter persicinus]